MKPLELDAFLSYRFLSQLSFSPDGDKAAVVVSQADKENNAYQAYIWVRKNETWMQLTAAGKERTFIWEDNTHLLFPAVRSEAEKKRAESGEQFTAYYRISVDGGEAQAAFTLPMAVSSLKKIREGLWLASAGIDCACPDYATLSEEDRKKEDKRKKDNADYEVFTEIPFYGNGAGFTDKTRTALFLYHEADGTVERLTDPLMDAYSPVIDGDRIYFLALTTENVMHYEEAALWVYDLTSGEKRVLASPEELELGYIEKVGSRLLVTAVKKSPYHISAEDDFYEVDPQSGAFTLFAENLDSLGNSTGSDCRLGGTHSRRVLGEKLYFTKTMGGEAHLACLNEDGTFEDVLTACGAVDDFDIAQDGQILLTGLYGKKLQEIYALKDGELKQISTFNEAVLADTYVADYQHLSVNSCGLEIEGWVLLPKDYDENGTYPAILDIHGGPRTMFGPVFYHEMQVWASRGYFVFFCNPVGGSGFGAEFADITGEYGQRDFKNIMDFTDAVLAAYPQIDPSRVGCTGGSYGGFMSNWIMGHTDRFAAIATQRSISNWISFYGVSDIGYFFVKNQLNADIYSDEGLKAMWDQSPLKYINNMKTPTLFIHSNEDYRCPMEQGMQLYTALKEKGVPARFCYFKGENHELSRSGKPLHRQRRLQEITDWMDLYCNKKEESEKE